MSAIKRESYIVFPSFDKLREAHSALLQQEQKLGAAPHFLVAIERFIEVLHTTGLILDNDAERRAAQSILDYWAASLLRARRAPPAALLADFNNKFAPALKDEDCPYIGLNAFHESDSSLFFGRQRLIAQLIQKLASDALLAVVGPSGSGKSSAILGGLIPALRSGAITGSERWHIYPSIVPGSQPLTSLLDVLRPRAFDTTMWRNMHIGALRQRSDYLAELIATLDKTPIVLVVDQFEEIFTLCSDTSARDMFVANLLGLIDLPGSPHKVIMTMRLDFQDNVAKIPELQHRFEEAKVEISAMETAELREAIEGPARMVGLKFDDGVVDALVKDILGERSGLPLLQHALLALWDRRKDKKNRVTMDAYRDIGSARQALSLSADAFFDRLLPEDQIATKRLLLQLVQPDEGLEVTSRRMSLGELYQIGERPQKVDEVLERLKSARLVRITAGDRPEDTQAEVAHEALVRNWDRLVGWVAEERDTLRRSRRLEAAAEEWYRRDRSPDLLLRGGVLEEASQLQDIGPRARAFLEASREASEQETRKQEVARQRRVRLLTARAEAERQRAEEATLREEAERQRAEAEGQRAKEAMRREQAERQRAEVERQRAEDQAHARQQLQRRQQWLMMALIGLLLALIVASFTSWLAQQRLQQAQAAAAAQQTESARRFGANETAQSAQSNGTATVGALQATTIAVANSAQTQIAAVANSAQTQIAADRTTLAQFVPAATIETQRNTAIAVANIAQTDALAAQSTLQAFVAGETNRQIAATQTFIAVEATQQVAAAQTSTALPVADRNMARVLTCQANAAPDQQLGLALAIMAADSDQGVLVENALQHAIQRVRPPIIDSRRVSSVSWNYDSQYLISTGADNVAKVWPPNGQNPILTLVGNTGPLTSAAWSSNGWWVVTGGADGTVRIYDGAIPGSPGERQPLVSINAHRQGVTGVSWSPDDRMIVSTGTDQWVRGWDATNGNKLFERPISSVERVTRSAFSVDGSRFVTSSLDGVARIRSSSTGEELVALQHSQPITSAVWRPDGTTILTADQDGAVRIWDIATARVQTFFTPNPAINPLPAANNASSSPSGRSIVSAWDDNVARVWALVEPQITYILDGSGAALTSATWSPDSRRIVTGAANGQVRVYYVYFEDILAEAHNWNTRSLSRQEQDRARAGELVAYPRTAECP